MDAKREVEGLVAWLAKQIGTHRAVIGISGGVDSAVVTAAAVQAVGADRVDGYFLGCESVPLDFYCAKLVAERFKVRLVSVDLSPALRQVTTCLHPLVAGSGNPREPLTIANLKSRLRMVSLYAAANLNDGIVLGTSNLTETMIGYFTKYGDGGVDLEPIAAYFKDEVYELAREFGVPQEVIDRPPSAGLWPNQTDEGELGYTYKLLDAALRQYYDSRTPCPSECSLDQFQAACVFIRQRMQASQHKREVPPIYWRLTDGELREMRRSVMDDHYRPRD